ncbi:hypothetical protein FTUN_8953 [Frigoriglobus tundricola]|uniref:Uncharacterized protein n=1 Tax=Frigoriglobus tundricola TaxID=2774151 RepID=A0A6M5Z4Z9_9BACT|nr:hypothetical protein FTUN_8953 [Frigoriglobus tundricola]
MTAATGRSESTVDDPAVAVIGQFSLAVLVADLLGKRVPRALANDPPECTWAPQRGYTNGRRRRKVAPLAGRPRP